MHSVGFAYNNPNQPEADIKKHLNAITQNAPLDNLPDTARTALTELQGEERTIAAADYKCRVKSVKRVEKRILRELYTGSQQ